MACVSCPPIQWQFWNSITLFTVSVVQFHFGWFWKHASHHVEVRYILKAFSSLLSGEYFTETVMKPVEVYVRICHWHRVCHFKVTFLIRLSVEFKGMNNWVCLKGKSLSFDSKISHQLVILFPTVFSIVQVQSMGFTSLSSVSCECLNQKRKTGGWARIGFKSAIQLMPSILLY